MSRVLLNFIHISDTHYAPPSYQGSYGRYHPQEGTQALINTLNALPYTPDFILHTGDVAYDPHPEIYAEIRSVFSALRVPVYYVVGNHDHSATLQQTLMNRATPQTPLYYETSVNDVRLLFIDTNTYDYAAVPPPAGIVSAEQLAWLAERLAQADPRPVIIATHHPLLKTHTSEWYDVFMNTRNGEAVHAVLKPHAPKIRGVFFGHVHQNISFVQDGILYSAASSSWVQFATHPHQDMQTIASPQADPGYSLVTVTEAGTIVQRFHYRVG